MRPGGQVVDGVGGGVGDDRVERGLVGDVGFQVDGDDLVALLPEVLGQPVADEPPPPRDQRARTAAPYRQARW